MKLLLLFPHQVFEVALSEDAEQVALVQHPLFFNQLPFHRQKLMLHHASMKQLESDLLELGRRVHFFACTPNTTAEDFEKWASDLTTSEGVTEWVVYDLVDDWLEQGVRKLSQSLGVGLTVLPSPGFLTTQSELDEFFGPEKSNLRMAPFYQWQRRRLGVLLDSDSKPIGGKWSFDEENRKRLPKGHQPTIQLGLNYSPEQRQWLDWAASTYANNPGSLDFSWPVTRSQAKEAFSHFLEFCLHDFGAYEDAMHTDDAFVYHSRLSVCLNCGLLTPSQVLDGVLDYSKTNPIPIASLEGFIRQLIGWREFMRAAYSRQGRRMRTRNFLNHSRPLPSGFWDATTGVEPLDCVIRRVLQHGYSHHIERLMVAGCFLMLCEADPDEAYEWFMALYMDAYDWVMVPNLYGMSQFADGGSITTKPYICGSNYIKKMSNFADGEWASVWDGLYWRFVDKNRTLLLANQRAAFAVRMLDSMAPGKREGHLSKAQTFLERR